jgi:hypothetical protein
MNDERDALSPAEQRVAALLALLRSDLVRTQPGLVAAIMRRVRWQQLVREVVSTLGNFASSVANGVTVFLGRSDGHRR